jgi:uncharacterized protein (TIGR03905 family)
MTGRFTTTGVCSKEITYRIENNVVRDVVFTSGCPGNLQGISRLVEGMEVREVIRRLKGITCGQKDTSCPDQLAHALEEALGSRASAAGE